MNQPLPTQLEPVAALIGTWSGHGRGDYPTIEAFEYDEEVSFGFGGKPLLAYTQQTWSIDPRAPLHAESGYLRPQAGNGIEVVLAIPTGHVEVLEGTLDGDRSGGRIGLKSTVVAATTHAKPVAATRRHLDWDTETLRYEMSMAAVDVAMQLHVTAELVRA